MKESFSWTRLSIEVMAIVVSILLAFSIDAWWDGRGDRSEEREILLGLQADFVELQAELVSNHARSTEIVEYIVRLLSWADESPGTLPLAEADTAFRRLLQSPAFQPGQTTLEGLLGSGRLDLIENRALRVQLSQWQHQVVELVETETLIRDFIRQSLIPYLAAAGVPLLRAYRTPLAGSSGGVGEPRPPTIVDDLASVDVYVRILSNVEFRSLAAYRHNWARLTVGRYEVALAHSQTILETLRRDLAEN